MAGEQREAPIEVPIVPVETSFVISKMLVPTPGGEPKNMVLLRVGTPTGIQAYFLPPDGAINVGKQLRETGKQLLGRTASGLHTPFLNGSE